MITLHGYGRIHPIWLATFARAGLIGLSLQFTRVALGAEGGLADAHHILKGYSTRNRMLVKRANSSGQCAPTNGREAARRATTQLQQSSAQ